MLVVLTYSWLTLAFKKYQQRARQYLQGGWRGRVCAEPLICFYSEEVVSVATAPFSDSSVSRWKEFTVGWWAQWVITFCNENDWEIARSAKQRQKDRVNHLFGEIKEGIQQFKKRLNERCGEENESSVHKSMQGRGSAIKKKGEWRNKTAVDRMTYEGDDDDYNYFCDDVDEVDIWLASKWAEKWRSTMDLFGKGQPLPTFPTDSCTSVSRASSLTRSLSRLYHRSSSMALLANKSTS